jgi:type 2 lantibiotic biosynthesis protein LanM
MLGRSPDRCGVTLAEYADLPTDVHFAPDENVRRRLDIAISHWQDQAGEFPLPVRDRSAEDLRRLIAGRYVPGGHPIAHGYGWILRAARCGSTVPLLLPPMYRDNWHGPLLQVLGPMLHVARQEALQAVAGGPELARHACALWFDTPPAALARMLTGAFVLDMRSARALAAECDVLSAENWFDKHLLAICERPGGRTAFLDRYPLLARLLAARIQGWRDAGVEFAMRLAADEAVIAMVLGAECLTLHELETHLGDPHLGGRAVARVRCAEGDMAYKPRPVGAAKVIRDLAERLRTGYGIGLEITIPDVIDRDDYGWLRWVESRPCNDHAGLRRYYHRLGQLSAFAWLLGAADLHAGNIIADGDVPVLVDVESMLSPVERHAESGHSHAAPGILLESPLSTGILPLAVDVGGGEYADYSAFGASDRQAGAEITTWDGAGTGDMHATRRRVPPGQPRSVPTDDMGNRIDAFEYGEDFLRGSDDLLASVEAAGSQLLADDAITSIWQLHKIRVVLRDTSRYGAASEVLCHPAALHNPFLSEGAFQNLALQMTHPDPDYHRSVLASERAALLRGDVPYFEVAASGRDLRSCDGTVLPGFFAGTPTDKLRSRLVRATMERPALEWATRAALHVAARNRTRQYAQVACCRDAAQPQAGPDTLVAAATAVGRRLADLALHDGGEISWLTIRSIRGEPRWEVQPADDSVYHGRLGVLLFLEYLCRETAPDARLRGLRDQLREQWLAGDPATAYYGAGALDGLAGDLYIASILAAHDGNQAYLARARQVVTLLGSCDISGLDWLSGAAGVAVVLCRAATAMGAADPVSAMALGRARQLVQDILCEMVPRPVGASWDTLDGEPLIGFAHGSAGIAFALSECAMVLEPTLAAECESAVRAACAWERSCYDESAGNWPDLRPMPGAGDAPRFSATWCSGSAGIGLARGRLLLRSIPGEPDSASLQADLRRAVGASCAVGLGHGQGLCHGDMGVAETLLVAAQSGQQPGWQGKALGIAHMVAAEVLAHDGLVTLEFGPRLDLPGLFNGAAGIGYELLRCAFPRRVPSILTLECPP